MPDLYKPITLPYLPTLPLWVFLAVGGVVLLLVVRLVQRHRRLATLHRSMTLKHAQDLSKLNNRIVELEGAARPAARPPDIPRQVIQRLEQVTRRPASAPKPKPKKSSVKPLSAIERIRSGASDPTKEPPPPLKESKKK